MTMEKAESLERFRESLMKAHDRAKQLGKIQKNNNWFAVATQLKKLLENGVKLSNQAALSQQQIDSMLDLHVDKNYENEAKKGIIH